MPITLVQVIGENVTVVNGFATVDKAVEHVKSLTHLNIYTTSKTIQCIIDSDSKINMDGYYIKKTDDINSFDILERTTDIYNGWITSDAKQNTKKIGFIKLVDDNQKLNVDETIDNCNNSNEFIIVQNTEKKKHEQHNFPVAIINEFMKKVQEKKLKQTKPITEPPIKTNQYHENASAVITEYMEKVKARTLKLKQLDSEISNL